MNIPDTLPEEEIKEIRWLYEETRPERIAVERMVWLENEYAKLIDVVDHLTEECPQQAIPNDERRVFETREAFAELAKTARTTEQLDMVHQFKCRGLLK